MGFYDCDKLFLVVTLGVKIYPREAVPKLVLEHEKYLLERLDDTVKVIILPDPSTTGIKVDLMCKEGCKKIEELNLKEIYYDQEKRSDRSCGSQDSDVF